MLKWTDAFTFNYDGLASHINYHKSNNYKVTI